MFRGAKLVVRAKDIFGPIISSCIIRILYRLLPPDHNRITKEKRGRAREGEKRKRNENALGELCAIDIRYEEAEKQNNKLINKLINNN